MIDLEYIIDKVDAGRKLSHEEAQALITIEARYRGVILGFLDKFVPYHLHGEVLDEIIQNVILADDE